MDAALPREEAARRVLRWYVDAIVPGARVQIDAFARRHAEGVDHLNKNLVSYRIVSALLARA